MSEDEKKKEEKKEEEPKGRWGVESAAKEYIDVIYDNKEKKTVTELELLCEIRNNQEKILENIGGNV